MSLTSFISILSAASTSALKGRVDGQLVTWPELGTFISKMQFNAVSGKHAVRLSDTSGRVPNTVGVFGLLDSNCTDFLWAFYVINAAGSGGKQVQSLLDVCIDASDNVYFLIRIATKHFGMGKVSPSGTVLWYVECDESANGSFISLDFNSIAANDTTVFTSGNGRENASSNPHGVIRANASSNGGDYTGYAGKRAGYCTLGYYNSTASSFANRSTMVYNGTEDRVIVSGSDTGNGYSIISNWNLKTVNGSSSDTSAVFSQEFGYNYSFYTEPCALFSVFSRPHDTSSGGKYVCYAGRVRDNSSQSFYYGHVAMLNEVSSSTGQTNRFQRGVYIQDSSNVVPTTMQDAVYTTESDGTGSYPFYFRYQSVLFRNGYAQTNNTTNDYQLLISNFGTIQNMSVTSDHNTIVYGNMPGNLTALFIQPKDGSTWTTNAGLFVSTYSEYTLNQVFVPLNNQTSGGPPFNNSQANSEANYAGATQPTLTPV